MSNTAPICDDCWRKQHGKRPPVRLTKDTREKERCHLCNTPTNSGIYVRAEVAPTDPPQGAPPPSEK